MISIAAALIGYDPAEAGGVFTFGGTGTLLYGVQIGLEKAIPGSVRSGVRDDAVVLASKQSHYSCLTVAAWLGIGQDNVIAVPTHLDNSIDVPALEAAATRLHYAGRRIAAIVATLGTTDAFGIDDLQAIHHMRERLVEKHQLDYRPHIHADAVIGWAWSVFNDYDFLQTRSASAAAPSAPWPPPRIASATCRWPIRSASIFTRPASARTSRRWCCSPATRISS